MNTLFTVKMLHIEHLNQYLFSSVNNAPLVIFRAIFGFLIAAECIGAIFTGWIYRAFIEPQVTFPFIGFEFLRVFNQIGWGAYVYYFIMGILGIFIMLGLYYRWSMSLFLVMWTACYMAQKTNYNNHYYLLVLLSLVMIFLPANRRFSLDVRRKPKLKSNFCPQWVILVLHLQLFIVYTYASIAKIHPDWLAGIPVDIWFNAKADYPIIGSLLQQVWFRKTVVFGGIFFDLLIIPALWWRITRLPAFIVSIFFHMFNSIVFGIGIFPYLMIGMNLLFFPPEKINKLFFGKLADFPSERSSYNTTQNKSLIISLISVYLLVQIALPLRHLAFKDYVLWTEEGHRMAWRMMLRTKSGIAYFIIKDKSTGRAIKIQSSQYLTPKQSHRVPSQPDMLWQFSQFLAKEYKKKGWQNPEVYAFTRVYLNKHPPKPMVDSLVNLANEPWYRFKHHDWIMPFEDQVIKK